MLNKKSNSCIYIFFSKTSCELAGKDIYFQTLKGTPKLHYSSTSHNVGPPSSIVLKNGIYYVFNRNFHLDENQKNSICKPEELIENKSVKH